MLSLGHDQLAKAIYEILLPSQQKRYKEFAEQVECVFACELPVVGRIRMTIYKQMAGLSVAIRLIVSTETIETLTVYKTFSSYANRSGLILVAGHQSSGRTTTAGAFIHYLNQFHSKHIVTLENPIEIKHPNKYSLIDQREQFTDYTDRISALNLVRSSAVDVLYMDYLDDYRVMLLLMEIAASGCLVIANFFSNDVESIVRGFIDRFNLQDRKHAQFMLANVLLSIYLQKQDYLDGQSFYSYELFTNNHEYQEDLREGRFDRLNGFNQKLLKTTTGL